jgi:hypothetical protein
MKSDSDSRPVHRSDKKVSAGRYGVEQLGMQSLPLCRKKLFGDFGKNPR